MVIRPLKKAVFERFCSDLEQYARREPLDAAYTLHMTVSSVEYIIKLQPERDCRLAILQACRIHRETFMPAYELITDGGILHALLSLIAYQGIPRN